MEDDAPELPPELWYRIVSVVDERGTVRDLSKLAQASRSLRDIASKPLLRKRKVWRCFRIWKCRMRRRLFDERFYRDFDPNKPIPFMYARMHDFMYAMKKNKRTGLLPAWYEKTLLDDFYTLCRVWINEKQNDDKKSPLPPYRDILKTTIRHYDMGDFFHRFSKTRSVKYERQVATRLKTIYRFREEWFANRHRN